MVPEGRRKNGMPKKKTNKAAAKRFRKTAKGKLKYSKAGTGHLLAGKTRKRKRNLRRGSVVGKSDEKRIRAML
jgi:large subunit ribosomal protein L35